MPFCARFLKCGDGNENAAWLSERMDLTLIKKIPIAWRWAVAAICAMLVLTPFLLSAMVQYAVVGQICEEETPPQTYEVILILGCGVKANGEPSDMLEDRLKTGVALYQAGVAPKILLSADYEFDDYNEIAVMKRFCLDAGVPEEQIITDRYGLSTYDSIVRAATLYDIDRAVIVTQEYHLYRALYIAGKMGMETVGVDADIRTYRLQTYRDVREVLARCKDFYAIQRKVLPQYLTVGEDG